MNPEFSKLKHEERTDSEAELKSDQESQQQAKQEFAGVDEMLRFDSHQNPVPAEVAERLNRSIAAEPKPERSWLKKLLGSK